MKVFELCGMPGCGKSTAFRAFKESYPEAAQRFKGQKDLYPKAKWMWAVLKLWCRVRIGLGLLDATEKKLTELMKGDGKNVPVYKAKVLALYSRFKKYADTDECFILDEGLVQHMTSAFYQGSVKDAGIKKMKMPWEYEGIYFFCDPKEAVRRNRQRGRNNRYNISDDSELEKILLTKDENIKAIMSLLCDHVSKIDRGESRERCGELTRDILVSRNKRQ